MTMSELNPQSRSIADELIHSHDGRTEADRASEQAVFERLRQAAQLAIWDNENPHNRGEE